MDRFSFVCWFVIFVVVVVVVVVVAAAVVLFAFLTRWVLTGSLS